MNRVILSEPIERPVSKLIGFNVRLTDLVLGTSVRIFVEINYQTGNTYSSENKVFNLEGDDYLSWGNDDNYINDFVKSKILAMFQVETSVPSLDVENGDELTSFRG